MSGLYPDNRPPLKATFANPNRKQPGRRCPSCDRTKDKGSPPGLCRGCRDSRDMRKQWAAEDAAQPSE